MAIVLSRKSFLGTAVLMVLFKTTVEIICNPDIENSLCGVANDIDIIDFCIQDKV